MTLYHQQCAIDNIPCTFTIPSITIYLVLLLYLYYDVYYMFLYYTLHIVLHRWNVYKVLQVPPTANFMDYSEMSVHASTNRMAITSQVWCMCCVCFAVQVCCVFLV